MKFNKIILSAIFVIACYSFFILLSDKNLLYAKFTHLKYYDILLALSLFSLGYFTRSFRFIAMLRFIGIKIPLVRNIVIYFTGYAFALTPGKLGEGIRSKYLKDDFQISISKTIPTVFAERFYDVIGVLSIAFITYGISKIQSIPIFISGGILILLYFFIKLGLVKKVLISLQRFNRLSKVSDNLIHLSENLGVLLKRRILLQSSFLTVISWWVESIGAYFIFSSFGLNLSLFDSIFTYSTTSLIGAATFLPGGVGGTEGALLGLLMIRGYDYNEALGAVLMIRIFALWYVIILGLFFILIYRLKYRHTK